MKKKISISILVLVMSAGTSRLFAQRENVGIGTTNPNSSAALEIESGNKGLLIPRMTENQRNNIKSPANALLVYQTNGASGFYFFEASKNVWSPLNSNDVKSIAADPFDWTLSGNALNTSSPGNSLGTTNFIGSTNAAGIVFKTTASGLLTGFISPTNTNLTLGYKAGGNLASGTTFIGVFNTAIGTEAMAVNTSGSKNVSIGFKSLFANANGSDNVALGTQALTANVSGSGNVAVGYQSMRTNVSGGNNLAFGLWTLRDNQTGGTNVAIGYGALAKNTSGSNNVGIGGNTLQANLIGTDNTAIGLNAGYSALGTGNLFLGRASGYTETGSNNLYLANSSTTTPLIKGSFDGGNVKINVKPQVGSSTSTLGFLAIGDFSDANFNDATKVPVVGNGYRLYVQDGLMTEKIKVALKSTADWADYVFEPEYKHKMMTLGEVEKFINENKHLPNVPSANEMASNGIDVSKTSKMFMEKIEELTLYLIELNKDVKALKLENENLKSKSNNH
jgi:hypothetical protein